MNRLIILFFFLSGFTLSLNVQAKRPISSIVVSEKDYSFESKVTNSSTYLTLGYLYGRSEINHRETATNINFYSLNEQTKIPSNILELNLQKEFLASKLFSLSFLVSGAYGVGAYESKNSANIVINDEVKEYQYGGGVSLNLNLNSGSIKIQPFAAAQYLKSKAEYELNYNINGREDHGIIISYDINREAMKYSAGIRFYNKENSLLSYFSADYMEPLSENYETHGSINKSPLKLSTVSEVDKRPLTISVGFGFML